MTLGVSNLRVMVKTKPPPSRVAVELSMLLGLSAAYGGMVGAAHRLGFARSFGVSAVSLGVDLQSILLQAAVGIAILLWGVSAIGLFILSLFSGSRGRAYTAGSLLVGGVAGILMYWTRKLENAQGDVQELLFYTFILAVTSGMAGLISRAFFEFHAEIRSPGWRRTVAILAIASCLTFLAILPVDDMARRVELAVYLGAAAYLSALISYLHPEVRRVFQPRPVLVRLFSRFGAFSVVSATLSAMATLGLIYIRPKSEDHTLIVTVILLATIILCIGVARSYRRGNRWIKAALPIPIIALTATASTVAMTSGVYAYHAGYSSGVEARSTSARSIDDDLTLTEYMFGTRYFWVCPIPASGDTTKYPRSLLLAQSGESYVLWSEQDGATYLPVGSVVLKQNC